MYDATVFDKIKTLVPSRPRRIGNHRRQQRLYPRRLHDLLVPGRLVDRCRHVRFAVARGQSGGAIGCAKQDAGPGRQPGRSGARLMAPKARSRGARLASSGDLELAIPECAKGIGIVILRARFARPDRGRARPAASRLSRRPRIFPGSAAHGPRPGRRFPAGATQVSAALNYPGTIKAFHFHLHQTDCWTPVKGLLQVALVDLRLASPTFGARNTFYVGPLRPWQFLIPPGVGHGYKVIGKEDSHAGLHDRPLLQSARTKAAFPTTTRPSITIGRRRGSRAP